MSQNAQGFASTTNLDASGQGYPVQGMQGQGPAWFGAQWIPLQQTMMQQNVQARAPGFGCACVYEKRKPKYTSCVPKSTLSYETLRQTQTPAVVATPQLLSSLQCQNKGTCSTPTPKCTSELLLFSPDATVTRNRSTRTKDGTQPRNTKNQRHHRPKAKVATVSLALGDTAV